MSKWREELEEIIEDKKEQDYSDWDLAELNLAYKENKLDEYENTIERHEILIDKMKKCENCKIWCDVIEEVFFETCRRCKSMSKWELSE